MATLKDIWDYPNNSSSGYANDPNNWSGDNSYGLDKRIEDLRTGTYTAWPNINPSTDLTRNGVILDTQDLSTALSQYSNYVDSFSDDTNLTFRQIYKHELAEMSSFVNGAKVTQLNVEWDSVGVKFTTKVTTDSTTPHNLTSGDEINGFAFADDSSAGGTDNTELNYTKYKVGSVVDANNFFILTESDAPVLFSGVATDPDHGSTTETQAATNQTGGAPWLIPHNDGSYNGVLLGFYDQYSTTYTDNKDRGEDTGDTFVINKAFDSSVGGTLGSANVGDIIYLEKFRKNVYKTFSDAARTIPYTMTYDNTHSTTVTVTMGPDSNWNYIALATVVTDSSLISWIEDGYSHGEIFYGFCRLRGIQGTTPTGHKALPSSLDTSEYFHYHWDTQYNSPKFFDDFFADGPPIGISPQTAGGHLKWNEHTDPQDNDAQSKSALLKASTSTDEVEFEVEFFKPLRGGGAILSHIEEYAPTTGSQAGGILTTPLIGKYNVFFDHTGVTSTSSTWPSVTDLTAGITNNTTMFLPGNQVYSYQDSSNVTQYAAGNIDFTKRWRPRYLNGAALEQSVTWITNPVVVPNVNGSGYVDNTYTITNPGAITLGNYYQSIYSDASVSEAAWLTNIEAGPFVSGTTFPNFNWNWGVSKFQQRADEYVAPTPYGEDFFDRGDEWDTEAYDGSNAKQWPKHITPSSIKVVQATPSSVTTSQNGVKYVRASGIIRHQLQVEYPPMDETAFREFEATVAAARGQATPFYFDFTGYNGKTIAFNRIDDNNIYNTVALRYPVTKGDNYITLEGYQANQTDAVLPGEYMVFGGSADGGLLQTVSGDDSNVFGEIKFRMAVGSKFDHATGVPLYKNPAHAIVTIAEDTLEYSIGTDQLYRFSVRFDWDQWK